MCLHCHSMDLKAMKVSDSPGIVELQILLWREKWQRTRVTWNWYCMGTFATEDIVM